MFICIRHFVARCQHIRKRILLETYYSVHPVNVHHRVVGVDDPTVKHTVLRECRVGMSSGNVEWECRVGMSSGNVEWECRVGMSSGRCFPNNGRGYATVTGLYDTRGIDVTNTININSDMKCIRQIIMTLAIVYLFK